MKRNYSEPIIIKVENIAKDSILSSNFMDNDTLIKNSRIMDFIGI